MKLRRICYLEREDRAPDWLRDELPDEAETAGIVHYWFEFDEACLYYHPGRGEFLRGDAPSEGVTDIPVSEDEMSTECLPASFLGAELLGITRRAGHGCILRFATGGGIEIEADYPHHMGEPGYTYWSPLFYSPRWLAEPENAATRAYLEEQCLEGSAIEVAGLPHAEYMPTPEPQPTAQAAPTPQPEPAGRESAAPQLSQEPEPLGKQAGRMFSGFFLLLMLLNFLPTAEASIPALLIILLFWGGLPALFLMFSPAPAAQRGRIYRGIAIGALYAIFLPSLIWCGDIASSDAQGGLIYIFIAPVTHGAWLVLAAPYLIHLFTTTRKEP